MLTQGLRKDASAKGYSLSIRRDARGRGQLGSTIQMMIRLSVEMLTAISASGVPRSVPTVLFVDLRLVPLILCCYIIMYIYYMHTPTTHVHRQPEGNGDKHFKLDIIVVMSLYKH